MLLSPVISGYCFRFVCLSGTLFFSFCARNSSYSFHHTQTKPIPSESWVSGVCHGGSVFFVPPKFRQNRSLKTSQNHKFQFFELYKSKSFGSRNAIPIPYESPAQFVRTSNIFVRNDFWKCLRQRLPGEILSKTAVKFRIFFLNECVREGTGDPVQSGL